MNFSWELFRIENHWIKFTPILLARLHTQISANRLISSQHQIESEVEIVLLADGKIDNFPLLELFTARTVVVVINGCREVRRRIGCKSDGNTTNDKRAEMKGEEVGRKKSVIFYRIFFSFLCFSSHLRSPQYGEKQQESRIYAQTRQRVKNCCSRMKRRHMKENSRVLMSEVEQRGNRTAFDNCVKRRCCWYMTLHAEGWRRAR